MIGLKAQKCDDAVSKSPYSQIPVPDHPKFNNLVIAEKHKNGNRGTELADEAMRLLFKKYGVKCKD